MPVRRLLALGVMAMAAVAWVAWQDAGPARREAPGFDLVSTGFEGGELGAPQPFALSDYRGTPVLLDLMAVDCLPCRGVTDRVVRPIHTQLSPHGLVVLSVDTWADPATGYHTGLETDERLIRLQQEEGAPWRHALDTDSVWRKYDALTIPKLVVVDAEGLIVDEWTGASLQRGAVERAVLAAMPT